MNNGRNLPSHVLHIASGDLMAGAEHMLEFLCRQQLKRPNFKVSAALLNSGELASRLMSLGVNVTLHEEKTLRPYTLFRSIFNTVRSIQPDVIHTHRFKENILGGLCSILSGIPSIRTVHGAPEYSAPFFRIDKKLIKGLETHIGRRFQERYVAVSDSIYDHLISIENKEKIIIIENGIDKDCIVKKSSEATSVIIRGDTRLAFLGRLAPVKGVEKIIEALALCMPDATNSVHLYIVGDGPEKISLESLTKQLNISSNVHFCGYQNNPISILSKCDALILASDHEGLPISVLESLALGKPVLAPRLPGLSRIATKRNSILYNQTTVPAIAEAILELASTDKQWQIKLPPSNSAEQMEKKYFRLYSQICCHTCD